MLRNTKERDQKCSSEEEVFETKDWHGPTWHTLANVVSGVRVDVVCEIAMLPDIMKMLLRTGPPATQRTHCLEIFLGRDVGASCGPSPCSLLMSCFRSSAFINSTSKTQSSDDIAIATSRHCAASKTCNCVPSNDTGYWISPHSAE